MRLLLLDRAAALLGEEPLTIRVVAPCEAGFFPISGRNGYQVTQEDQRIVIKPVRPTAALLGWAPVFYFAGQLHSMDGTSVLQGTIKMKASSKVFILAWISLVLVGLTFGSVYALYSAFRWSLNPTEASLAALQGAGLMVGIGVCMLFFAALLVFVQGLFNRKERQGLKEFCKRYAM